MFSDFGGFPTRYEGIKDWVNRELRECFLDAEAQLIEDVLRGNRFEEYWQYESRKTLYYCQ